MCGQQAGCMNDAIGRLIVRHWASTTWLDHGHVMPMHCSGQNFIDLAKQEMPDKLMLCGTGRQLHLHGVNRRGRTAQEVIVGVTRMGLDRVDEVAGWAHAGRSASWSPRFSEADAVSDEPASW